MFSMELNKNLQILSPFKNGGKICRCACTPEVTVLIV